MKIKNRTKKISIIAIILYAIIIVTSKSYGIATTVGVTGIVAVLALTMQIGAVLMASAINIIIAVGTSGEVVEALGSGVLYNLAGGSGSSSGSVSSPIMGIKSIVFNESKITTASFFEGMSYGTNAFAQKIGEYYYIIRNISIVALLFVLLYIGIRMVLSTVAEQEAKYKKMLLHWVISLVLVFMLHYIMIITFYINDSLVYALSQVAENKELSNDKFLNNASLIVQACVPITGIDECIVYCSFTIATVALFISYIKRVITLGFLIVIAPLITITYAIDKVGDGKSQALDTWLKEFIFTVLIQPFHCIIYLVFVNTAIGLVSGWGDGLFVSSNSILAIASVFFMLKAEGLVKKIFGLQADSMGDTLKNGTMAMAMATGLFKGSGGKGGSGGGSGGSGSKMPKMQGNKEGKTAPKMSQKDGTDTGKQGAKQGSQQTGPQSKQQTGPQSRQQTGPQSKQQTGPQGGSQKGPDKSKIEQKLSEFGMSEWAQEAKRGLTEMVPAYFNRKSGGKGAIRGIIQEGAKNGAMLFGAIAGGVLGDGNSMISTGMAAKSAMEWGTDKIGEMEDRKQLEKNQQTFAGAYEDYARAYRDEYGEDIGDDVIMQQVLALRERSGTEITEQYERDMYNHIQNLEASGEIVGQENVLEDTLRAIDYGTLKPPSDYEAYDYSEGMTEEQKFSRDMRRMKKSEGEDSDVYKKFRQYQEVAKTKSGSDLDNYNRFMQQEMEKWKSSRRQK